jgi:hypothetical protein
MKVIGNEEVGFLIECHIISNIKEAMLKSQQW